MSNLLIYLLPALGIISRFLPHPANFTAIGAIAIFGGLYLPRRWAITLPLLAMIASDAIIGFYTWQINLTVYISFGLMGLIGLWVRRNKKFHTILGGTILGSALFFVLTNFAVWAFGSLYPHSYSGIMQCYFMALPFFRNSLLGDIFYTAVLVGGVELMLKFHCLHKMKDEPI